MRDRFDLSDDRFDWSDLPSLLNTCLVSLRVLGKGTGDFASSSVGHEAHEADKAPARPDPCACCGLLCVVVFASS